jgi:cytochrome c oxidase subunit 1/cytochrome c oxidase subunit I+III
MAVAGTPGAAPGAGARRHLERLERIWEESPGIVGWLTTTDHKRIGILYFFTTLAFFAAGGVEALMMRTQLIEPQNGLIGPHLYNQTLTLHGVTMIFFFVVPISTGAFGNYLVPLMIGARDMAFPRLNAASYWIFLAAGLFFYIGVAIGIAPDAGWFNYTPLASKQFSPGQGIDLYSYALIFSGIATTATAINIIATIFKLRAPGMSLNRMPLFCYAFLAVSFALVFALPPLNVALLFLELDRQLGFNFYDVTQGGESLLWQHLFWIFGHPEVYIIILPAFGIATSIIPTFTRRKMVAFPLVALAELLVAFIGFGVWAHHMFAVGLPTVTTIYFAAASLIIVIPSGIQLFAWLTTIFTGTPIFKTPLLWIVGFIVMFTIGGLSGITFAAIPFDQQLTDSYYVVAHFHYVIFGAAVFPILGGMYYWFPKVTGRMYYERIGQASFWLTFLGTSLTFFPMHILGLIGMPRRQYTYEADLGWTGYNLLETIGSYVLAAGLLMVVANLAVSLFRGARAGNDPFGGDTLEWSTTSPPPPYNYAVIPRVTSPYAMWDRDDRAEDTRRLERGEMVLEAGHETPASTVLDAQFDEILDMPSESWWPFATAATLAPVFVMLLLGHWVTAGAFFGLTLLVLFAWHATEPQAA